DEKLGGVLEFGTEVVAAADGSIAALLGASPGASTAVSIMVTLMERCFPEQMKSAAWRNKLKLMIPSYGQQLNNNPTLAQEIRNETTKALHLQVTELV
ncbi:MAG: malate:quinone oxidoreductase, partial [Pedobacter sp.]|nr:malate:quinone oxidoreductase [Pedobacter sp.]